MQSRNLSELLLFSIILICCYPHIWAERLVEGSEVNKNSTTHEKAANQTTNQPKALLNETTVSATTTKSEEEITTLPPDIDLDGRSVFINNEFVAESEENLPDTATALHDPVQLPKITILMNSNINSQQPNMQDAVIAHAREDETEKLPQNPVLGYGGNQFDEYEEEETGEYASESESIPENCEDTQESLGDNDEADAPVDPDEQETLDNTYANNLEDEPQTNAKPDTNQELLNEPSEYVYGTELKPETKINLLKPNHTTQDYYEREYTEEQQLNEPSTNQNSYHKPPHYNIEKTPRPLLSKPQSEQPNKLESSFYNKRLYNGTLFHYSHNNLPHELSNALNPSNSPNPSFMPILSYDNSKGETISPFSSTSVRNKKFKTISSSIQYVSTPLADLVFKYSIGMAKHTKASNNTSENKPIIINMPYEVHENIKEQK